MKTKKDFTVTKPIGNAGNNAKTMNTMSIFSWSNRSNFSSRRGDWYCKHNVHFCFGKNAGHRIMKAIGAKNKDIILIFLINSGLIGLVGGIGGIILGTMGAGLIGSITSSSGMAGNVFKHGSNSRTSYFFFIVFKLNWDDCRSNPCLPSV
jgi:hypothetical protein